jgi:hypothetical protein
MYHETHHYTVSSSFCFSLSLSQVRIFSSSSCYHTPWIYTFPLIWETKFCIHTKQQETLPFYIHEIRPVSDLLYPSSSLFTCRPGLRLPIGRCVVLQHILIFMSLEWMREVNRSWTEWYRSFHELNMLLSPAACWYKFNGSLTKIHSLHMYY